MEQRYFSTIKETLYYETMDNGLQVYLLKKEGFSKTYGLFSTRFGSVDTSFIPKGKDEMIKVNDGVAHFLEHKMFDMPYGDASDAFSRLGASTNAFTSSSRTAYLFSTASNEEECVKLLLDFVQQLSITKESVEKEKGIIVQEINMYDDDPDWRAYFGSIANLYHNHPVRIDIAGDEQSVRSTTVNVLEECYHTFYHPSNMVLFVVGNIEPVSLMKMIEENQESKHFDSPAPIVRKEIEEPDTVYKKYEQLKMDVVMPKLMISIKVTDRIEEPKLKLKRELCLNLLLDLLFSKSSATYEEMMKEDLINDSFGAAFTQERDYAFIQMGGDTMKMNELKEKLIELIGNMNNYKIEQDDFERTKKKNIGSFINSFNSPENIANLFSRYFFEGIFSFEIIDVLNEITLEDVLEVRKYFNLDKMCVFEVIKKD